MNLPDRSISGHFAGIDDNGLLMLDTGGGKILPIACHVGRAAEIESLVKQIGPLDILVNNSATSLGHGPALEVTDEALMKTVEINVLSALRLIRLTVPRMIERGGGSIINIASISGLRPQPGGLVYSFTKAGLIMMTRVWAIEFGRHNIRVNAIAPGLIQTDFSEYFWKNEENRTRLEGEKPISRLGQPEDIGGLALFLASPDSSFITGQTYVVDGGATAA